MYNILKRKDTKKLRYEEVAKFETIAEVKQYITERNIQFAGTPYIFTHINLSDGSIVTQEFGGIICSPEKLREELQK